MDDLNRTSPRIEEKREWTQRRNGRKELEREILSLSWTISAIQLLNRSMDLCYVRVEFVIEGEVAIVSIVYFTTFPLLYFLVALNLSFPSIRSLNFDFPVTGALWDHSTRILSCRGICWFLWEMSTAISYSHSIRPGERTTRWVENSPFARNEEGSRRTRAIWLMQSYDCCNI